MMPARAMLGATEYRIQESEGLICFVEAHGLACGAFASRMNFTRCDSNIWRVSCEGVCVGDVLAAYREIEKVYGGPFGGTMNGETGAARGPYNYSLMPCNQRRKP